MIDSYRGIGSRKRVNGRKRTFVVDAQGQLWVADVDVVNQANGPLVEQLIASILWRVGKRLQKVFCDQAYNGVLTKELNRWNIDFEKASRPPWRGPNQSKVLCRWPSDRSWSGSSLGPTTFGEWSKTTSIPRSTVAVSSSVIWLCLANSQIMLQRIETYYQMCFPNTLLKVQDKLNASGK